MAIAFKAIVLFTIFQRLAELILAQKNLKDALNQGAILVKEKNYILMVLLHTTWLLGLLYYSFNDVINFDKGLFFLFLFLFLIGQSLRITAIITLGKKWNTRIVVLPKSTVIKKGIFKFLKHPNYLGVTFEIFALPAMAGLYMWAIVFSLINLIILYFRIRLEESILSSHTDYHEKFLS